MSLKHFVQIWTLAWDTDAGTDCQVFGSEAELFDFFRVRIEESIEEVQSPEANAIRRSLDQRDIGSAYQIWQESYKPELDTYNWGSQKITVEVSDEQS